MIYEICSMNKTIDVSSLYESVYYKYVFVTSSTECNCKFNIRCFYKQFHEFFHTLCIFQNYDFLTNYWFHFCCVTLTKQENICVVWRLMVKKTFHSYLHWKSDRTILVWINKVRKNHVKKILDKFMQNTSSLKSASNFVTLNIYFYFSVIY